MTVLFLPDGADQIDFERMYNVTRGTDWELKDQHDTDDVHIRDSNPDFEVGDAYNIRAEFNGIWGQREGHIPFIDTAAGETFATASGWTAGWINGLMNGSPSQEPDCSPSGFPAWLTLVDEGGCDELRSSYQSDTWTRAQTTVPSACVWTDIDMLECAEDTNYAYQVVTNVYVVDLYCSSALRLRCGRVFAGSTGEAFLLVDGKI